MQISKKLKNLNLEALAVGMYNFTTKNTEAKTLAEKRLLNSCLSCVHFKEEPITVFRVKDNEIPELTNMQCTDCGCVLAYKIRQSIKVCKLW
jgi:hypothetical protein